MSIYNPPKDVFVGGTDFDLCKLQSLLAGKSNAEKVVVPVGVLRALCYATYIEPVVLDEEGLDALIESGDVDAYTE